MLTFSTETFRTFPTKVLYLPKLSGAFQQKLEKCRNFLELSNKNWKGAETFGRSKIKIGDCLQVAAALPLKLESSRNFRELYN
jgi:hypothetical protein